VYRPANARVFSLKFECKNTVVCTVTLSKRVDLLGAGPKKGRRECRAGCRFHQLLPREGISKSGWTADRLHKMCCADHLPEVEGKSDVIGIRPLGCRDFQCISLLAMAIPHQKTGTWHGGFQGKARTTNHLHGSLGPSSCCERVARSHCTAPRVEKWGR
jgi:hypothetical protein